MDESELSVLDDEMMEEFCVEDKSTNPSSAFNWSDSLNSEVSVLELQSRKESIKSDYYELAILSPLQTAGVICCLENIIDLIRLIIFITPAACNDSWYSIICHKTISERFGTVLHEKIFEDVNGPVPNTDLLKLKYDCCTFDTSLVILLEELIGVHKFTNLLNVVDDQLLMKSDEVNLIDELSLNKTAFTALNNSLNTEQYLFDTNFKTFQHENFVLDQNLDDVQFETDLTEKFAVKYENERVKQNSMRLFGNTNELKELVKLSVKDYNNEFRIHSEVNKYMAELERDLEMSIVDWRNNYVEKIEHLEMLTIRTKANREEVLAQYEVLDEIFNRERDEMNKYLQEKEDRRLAAELFEKQKIMIVKLQAWWRGIRARKMYLKMKAALEKTLKKGKKGAAAKGKGAAGKGKDAGAKGKDAGAKGKDAGAKGKDAGAKGKDAGAKGKGSGKK